MSYRKEYWDEYKTRPEVIAKRKENSRRASDWLKAHPEKRLTAQRRWRMKKQYGITLEEYEILLEKQNGMCAICKSENTHSKGYCFAVDHDHKTGKVRGLLCHQCNLALGNIKDNVQTLHSMIRYLGG